MKWVVNPAEVLQIVIISLHIMPESQSAKLLSASYAERNISHKILSTTKQRIQRDGLLHHLIYEPTDSKFETFKPITGRRQWVLRIKWSKRKPICSQIDAFLLLEDITTFREYLKVWPINNKTLCKYLKIELDTAFPKGFFKYFNFKILSINWNKDIVYQHKHEVDSKLSHSMTKNKKVHKYNSVHLSCGKPFDWSEFWKHVSQMEGRFRCKHCNRIVSTCITELTNEHHKSGWLINTQDKHKKRITLIEIVSANFKPRKIYLTPTEFTSEEKNKV